MNPPPFLSRPEPFWKRKSTIFVYRGGPSFSSHKLFLFEDLPKAFHHVFCVFPTKTLGDAFPLFSKFHLGDTPSSTQHCNVLGASPRFFFFSSPHSRRTTVFFPVGNVVLYPLSGGMSRPHVAQFFFPPFAVVFWLMGQVRLLGFLPTRRTRESLREAYGLFSSRWGGGCPFSEPLLTFSIRGGPFCKPFNVSW